MNIRISTDIENQIYRHLQNPNEENEGKLFSIVRPALRDDIKRLKEVLTKIVTTGDQEVIIKELDKEKESIRRAYSSSQEKEDNESQELKSFRAELSVISLSENIAYLKTLTNKNPENYKKLINDSIKYLFQKFEEAYKESKCDTRIIGVIIGDYTHFLVRNLYTITHYEDYKTQSERSININTRMAESFERSQEVLIQATREKDETKKTELMYEYESSKVLFETIREEWAILQNSMYDESFQNIDINAKIEKFLKNLNPSIEVEDITTAMEPYVPEALWDNNSFYLMHNGTGLNNLLTSYGKITDTRQIIEKDTARIVDDKRKFILEIEQYSLYPKGVTTTAKMLLELLVVKITETGNPFVEMSLREYADIRGITDLNEFRRQVVNDLNILDSIRVSYSEKINGKYVSSGGIRLCGGRARVKYGKIEFDFSQYYFSSLTGYPIMPYSKEIPKFNSKRNPHSHDLLIKILMHKNMNYSKKNADTISIKTLIAACPNLPKYEDLGVNIQARQRIIDPFERDMNNISSIDWEYCGKNGVPIEYPERYEDFIKANVKIVWLVPYPERKAPVTKKKTLKKPRNEG